MGLSVEDIIAGNIKADDILDQLDDEATLELLSKVNDLEKIKHLDECRNHFIPYVKETWPIFIDGKHHRIMAQAFEDIINGKLKRLIINMPPRHTKSEFASYLLPSWALGRNPSMKIIQASHNADLAQGFGRKVRNLVGSQTYQNIFPGTVLSADSKAAGRWNTDKQGEYYAIGVGGAIAGRGADLYIIDDPHSEQDLQTSDPAKIFEKVYEWYNGGPRQRLQPGGAIVIVMTRWHKSDLTAQIINHAAKKGSLDEWRVIEFPMELPSGRPLWPAFWDKEHMLALKQDLPKSNWLAQYQQKPVSEEGAIVKREYWKLWPTDQAPKCDYIIQTWDTAYKKTQTSDFSACTTWGIFKQKTEDEDGKERTVNNIILLDAWQGRVEFPDLKRLALKFYRERKPDSFLVESKATGLPLIYELRSLGIPVAEHKVSRGKRNAPNDKVSRLHAIADIFESGMVWRPDTAYADEVVEQMASFPSGDHDDLVDAAVIAIERFRAGGFLTLPSDEDDEEEPVRVRANYY